jgi:uncharacterized membrane protein YqiK
MSTPMPELQQLREAAAAAAKLAQRDQELRAAHKAAIAERHRVHFAPPPTEEVLANMRRLVDEAARAWLAENAGAIAEAFAGRTDERPSGPHVTRRPSLWRRPGHFLDVPDLCGLAPEAMKARFEEAIRRRDARAGLPPAERAERVAELDRRIAAIEESHTTMVDAAARLPQPIDIPLLETVRSRRSAEREAKRRAAEVEAARKQAEAELAAREAAGRPPGRSGYLEQTGESVGDPFV